MVIKNKIKKYIKRFLPFLVLLVPFYASATRVNLDFTGLIDNSQVTKSLYINYEEGITNVSVDENGDPVYDHLFTFFVELRQFTGSAIKNYSGILRPYIKFNITSSDYISSYVEAPFYTEENISASVEYTSINSSQARFQIITTLDNCYVDTALPLLQFNYHIVTSSTVIPALSNFALDYSSQSGNYYRLSSQDDLATIIADAIDNSSDVQSIISILTHISSQSDLLTSVLSKVNNLDSTLSTALTYIINTDTNTADIETLLIRLYSMISGITSYNEFGNISMDIQAFQNYWLGIIEEAIQNVYVMSATDIARANEQNISMQSAESNLHSLENGYLDDLDDDAADIQWNVVAPSNIILSTQKILDFLDQLYAKLGNLKFLITVSLTMGIVVLVLGGALRYYRRGR